MQATSQLHWRSDEVADVPLSDCPQDRLKSRPRVLVVDDEPLIRWWLVESLGDHGCDVVEAGDGLSAVRTVSGDPGAFDAILLDFRLPDSNDLELLSRLRLLAPRARLILMTAYGTPDIQQGAMDRGAYRVVLKPFPAEEVVALVSENHPGAARV